MIGRLHTALFVAFCLVGGAAAVTLTVHEVGRTPAVALHVTHTERTGLSTDVTASVRNTTDQSRCVRIRIAARDRGGKDLAVVTAESALQLPAHARRTVRARLILTARQYAERLHAFYPSATPCGAG